MKLTLTHLTIAAIASIMMTTPSFAKIATGSKISDMRVTDASGVEHDLSDFAGKRVVLEWTNRGCPYVKKHYETDNMQRLQKETTADNDTVWLSIISSAQGKQGYLSGPEAIETAAEQGASPDAIILDTQGDMGRSFAAKTTPHMYIIDESQTLVYQGAIDDNRSANPATVIDAKNYVREAMADLDAGRPVADATTSPYGCSVKY